MQPAHRSARGRGRPPAFALLLPAAVATLAVGAAGGLLRIGVVLPAPPPGAAVASHGPLIVFGFLGVLIAVERAVALRRGWAFASPVIGVLGSVLLLSGASRLLAAGAYAVAGAIAGGAVLALLRRHRSLAQHCLLAACVVWVAGALLWGAGVGIDVAMPWWAAFLVLTIVGERVQFGKLASIPRTVPILGGLVALLGTGLLTTLAQPAAGMRVAGLAFIGLAGWLLVVDVRRRARRPGLLWFVSIGLLAGYAWLGITGVLWLALAPTLPGPLHDAGVHALFQGFVMGMVLAHAPMVFPAVTTIRMPFHRGFHAHLALLHVGLVVRVYGDVVGRFDVARIGSIATAVALGLFVVVTAASALGGVVHARAAHEGRERRRAQLVG